MNKELEDKANKLLKSLYKSVKKVSKKNAIDDVLDSNNIAEMSPDSDTPDTASVMHKAKGKKIDKCEGKKSCDCECGSPDEMMDAQKSEEFIGNIMKSFQMISGAYLEKKELIKNRMINEGEKRQLGYDKQSAKYQQHQEKIKGTKLDTEHDFHKKGNENKRIKNLPKQKDV